VIALQVAAHSACGQPFFNPDCGANHNRNVSEVAALAFAKKHGCVSGGDAAVRTCLRAIPAQQLARGPSPFAGHKPYYGSELLPDLPFRLFQRGEFDHGVKIMVGHNSGESVEMEDSCLNHPSLVSLNTHQCSARAEGGEFEHPALL
jgi:carboxylesterase type B